MPSAISIPDVSHSCHVGLVGRLSFHMSIPAEAVCRIINAVTSAVTYGTFFCFIRCAATQPIIGLVNISQKTRIFMLSHIQGAKASVLLATNSKRPVIVIAFSGTGDFFMNNPAIAAGMRKPVFLNQYQTRDSLPDIQPDSMRKNDWEDVSLSE